MLHEYKYTVISKQTPTDPKLILAQYVFFSFKISILCVRCPLYTHTYMYKCNDNTQQLHMPNSNQFRFINVLNKNSIRLSHRKDIIISTGI